MFKYLASFISYVFHPLLMPFLGMILLFNSGSYLNLYPFEAQKAIYTVVLLSMVVLPLCIIPLVFLFKVSKTMELDNLKERRFPYFFTLFFYYFAYFILKRANAPNIVLSIILASIITLSLTFLISLRFKISAHMIGIGGLTGAMMALSYRMMFNALFWVVLLILISGIIGSARLYLKKHKPNEIYSGYLLGAVSTLLVILLI